MFNVPVSHGLMESFRGAGAGIHLTYLEVHSRSTIRACENRRTETQIEKKAAQPLGFKCSPYCLAVACAHLGRITYSKNKYCSLLVNDPDRCSEVSSGQNPPRIRQFRTTSLNLVSHHSPFYLDDGAVRRPPTNKNSFCPQTPV